MRSIKGFLDEFVSALKENSYFADNDIKIINAYPINAKPTNLNTPIIAVGLGDIKLSSNEIGNAKRAGDICAFANVYVPTKLKSHLAYDIVTQICYSADKFNVLSITANQIDYDKTSSCYYIKSTFTFNEEIDFGGEGNE